MQVSNANYVVINDSSYCYMRVSTLTLKFLKVTTHQRTIVLLKTLERLCKGKTNGLAYVSFIMTFWRAFKEYSLYC